MHGGPRDLSVGVANLGDGYRVRHLLAKLDAGLPVVLSAIGSSVTAQFGGAIAHMQRSAQARTNAVLSSSAGLSALQLCFPLQVR